MRRQQPICGVITPLSDARADVDADFAAIVESDPDHAFAHKALGVIYMDYLPDPEGLATTHLRRYLELRGADDEVQGWIRRIRTRG